MERLTLHHSEVSQIAALVEEAIALNDDLESADFLQEAAVLAQEFSRRLRRRMMRFRLEEPTGGALLISGMVVDDERIGPTPSSLDQRRRTRHEEAYLVLVSSLLGDLIGWATQQSGHVIHEVFPIRDHEHMQIGTGCRQLLWWHTEDAFHPLRADYLALLCLRNPQRTPTTLASLQGVHLDEETIDLLFAPLYTIRPDESHLGRTGPVPDGMAPITLPDAGAGPAPLEKVSVLFGERSRPYLRLDPYFMDAPAEPQAARALETLVDRLDANLIDVALSPGDVLLVDNFRAVHGRRPFQARYDGADRWLKRTLIVRDLRKSLAARGAVESRIIR